MGAQRLMIRFYMVLCLAVASVCLNIDFVAENQKTVLQQPHVANLCFSFHDRCHEYVRNTLGGDGSKESLTK